MMDDFVVEYISTDYFLSLAFRRDFSCPSLYVFETFQQRIHHPAKKHLVPCHSRGTLRVSRGVTKFSLFFSFFFKLKKNSFSNIFLVLNELLFLSSSVLLHSLSLVSFSYQISIWLMMFGRDDGIEQRGGGGGRISRKATFFGLTVNDWRRVVVEEEEDK